MVRVGARERRRRVSHLCCWFLGGSSSRALLVGAVWRLQAGVLRRVVHSKLQAQSVGRGQHCGIWDTGEGLGSGTPPRARFLIHALILSLHA
jgi:hypothetical protein